MLKNRVPSLKKVAKGNNGERRHEDSLLASEMEAGGGRCPTPRGVFAFQEILNTIEANHGSFHFGELVHEFL
ncbi:hypothetical protein Csa_002638 [Cucumis sativus]|nr:hypothetical protein Csa_002638 [Cucumis sativus]